MATPIRAQDREHFEIVQQALAVDGLHVAISSADPVRLADYAGTLARALSSRHGLQVEAYQPGRLEALVADLMLHRYDGALSRISGVNGHGHAQAAAEATACVLFIPDAQSVRLQEFTQLARVASGLRQLRLVAMFSGSIPSERDARLQAMGGQLARWEIDSGDAGDTDDARAAPPSFVATSRTQTVHAAAPPRRARPWIAASAAAVAAATATVAVMLTIYPGPDGGSAPASATAPLPLPAPTLTRSGTVQLAGEPPADFRRAAEADDTASAIDNVNGADEAPASAAAAATGHGEAP